MDDFSNKYDIPVTKPLFPPIAVLLLLLLVVVLSSAIGFLAIGGMGLVFDIEMSTIRQALEMENTARIRNFMRCSILINHLTMFVLPALILAIWLYRRDWKKELNLASFPAPKTWIMGSLFMLMAMPLAQFSYWLNKQIPLPTWAYTMEEQTGTMVTNLLVADAPYELLFNILVVALIPALGEELIFRGFLQKQLVQWTKKPVLGLWIAAILFSAFHLQFEGFLARLLLGALLGYLYLWTNNLWVPIIGHFFNNAIQIIAQYFMKDQLSTMDLEKAQETISWSAVLFSAVMVIGIGWYFYQEWRSKRELFHNEDIS